MDVTQLQKQFAGYLTSLLREGYLDSQFNELQQLQDESAPAFVFEIVSLFFEDSQKILSDLSSILNQQKVEFGEVDSYVLQLKGSSSSIGAQRVKNACIEFREYCKTQNIAACLGCLRQVNQEYFAVKSKLERLLSLEHEILNAGGSIPVM